MTPADQTKPLIPYLRQSRARERTISIEEQWRDIRRWAKNAGVQLAPEVIEQNVSGSKPWRERELGAAIEACQRGEASGIIVAWQDRLSRENGLGTAEVWDALDRAGSRLVCAAEGLDTAAGDHEMLFSIKAAIAREQWKRHRANWQRAKHSAWERGLYVGDVPVGYRRADGGQLVRDENAAAVIQETFELRASGGSALAIANLLGERGAVTCRGRSTWSKQSARSVVENPIYFGLHSCTCGCGGSIVRDDWKIVEQWLWKRSQPKRDEHATYSRGEGHVLGEGLMRCGTCGEALQQSQTSGGSPGKRYQMMRCNTGGGGHASISYRKAAEYIVSAVVEHIGLLLSEIHVGENGAEIEAAEARLSQARVELAEVEAAEDELSPLAFGRALDKARRAVEEAEDALAALDRTEAWWAKPYLLTIAGGNWLAFEALPVPEQRRFLHEQIARVTLKPGRGAVEERLEIEWKREAGPRRIEAEGWTVLEFSDWAGLAFQGVPPDAPITSETLDALRERAVAELRRGGGLRRRATATQPEVARDAARSKK